MLWKQYFKNDTAALNVSNVYSAIANYGRQGNVAGVKEFCDLDDRDRMCTDDSGTITYDIDASGDGNFGSGGSTITFCSGFFNLPIEETCNFPTESNMQIADQGGVFLHELAKCEALTGLANVTDGKDDDCGTW